MPLIRTTADVAAFEQVPLEDRVKEWTVAELVFRGAAFDPRRVALYYLQDGDPQETPFAITFAELRGKAQQTANLLRRLFADRDGVVAVMLPLVPENYYLLCGTSSSGILCPVNWAAHPEQIAAILNQAQADVLVTLGPTPGFEIWEAAVEVLTRVPTIKHVIQVQGPGGTVEPEKNFSALIAQEPGDRLWFQRSIRPDDTAIYCPTGGTTGTPKLAKLSHRNIAYKCHAYAWILGHGPGDVIFAGAPLFHSGGMINRTLSPISCGITSVIVSPHGFRAPKTRENYWKLVERYRVTELVAPPTVLAALISQPLGDADISSLKKYANTGSSALPAATARAVEERFGVRILGNYGLTENTASAALSPRWGEPRYGASGIRLPYTQIKTVATDQAGAYVRDCALGEAGVIAIKGPGIISGYVDDGLNHGLFFPGGWLNTGDLGRIDEDGYIWVTGRRKDLIIRGGNNIDASIIDNTLLQHEAVELTAAVGKPDAYAGELPIAYVQLKPGSATSPDDLKAFTRTHIPEKGAAPVEVIIVDKMPLTEVGKIFKPPLRADAAKRTFVAALANMAGKGLAPSVEIMDDSACGMKATVLLSSMSGRRDPTAESRVRAIMDRFTVSYDVRWVIGEKPPQ